MATAKVFLLLAWVTALIYCESSVRKDASELPPAPFAHNCRIIFNEFNLFSPNEFQFVELKRFCKEETGNRNLINMEKYKLLFINPQKELVGVCHLSGIFRINSKFYYVVGQSGVPNVNFEASNCQLSTFQIRTLYPERKIRLPIGLEYPYAIVLVRNERDTVLTDLKLIADGEKYRGRKLTMAMEKTIMRNLQDYYIIGASSPTVFCDYFKTFYSRYEAHPNIMLRDWNGNNAIDDFSISRCANVNSEHFTTPMQPGFMKYSAPTPGGINNCDEAFTFFVASEVQTPRLTSNKCYSFFQTEASEVTFSTQPNAFGNNLLVASRQRKGANADPASYPNEIDELDAPAREEPLDMEVEEDDQPTQRAGRGRKKNSFVLEEIPQAEFEDKLQESVPFIWDDCRRFSENDLKTFQSFKYNTIDIEEVMKPETCNWIQYVQPTKQFRCKLCSMLLKQGILVERPGNIPIIATEGAGRLEIESMSLESATKSANTRIIKSHQRNPLHLQAIQYFKLFDSGIRGADLKREFEKPGGLFRDYMQATENMIVASIQSAQLGISFQNFKVMTDTLQYFDVPIGHLYRNSHGMSMGLQVISETMHAQLMKHLLTVQPDLSVTLDTYTDCGGYSSMAVVFQTYSADKSIKVYMYRVIYLPDGERGIQLFDKFIEYITKDGIKEYVRDKIVALGTDGAPALLSVFRQKLNEFASNEVLGIHCHCHRLELLMKKSLDAFEFMRKIDDTVNKLFRFFSSKSAKRNDILREEIHRIGVHQFRLKRIQRIRWVNSRERAMSPIITRFKPIVEALHRIAGDRSFRLNVREQAENLAEALKCSTFLGTIAFLLDVTAILTDVSKTLQLRGNTLIGKKSSREEVTDLLVALKRNIGPNVQTLLENSDIANEEEDPNTDVTFFNFETLQLRYFGILLRPQTQIENENTLRNKSTVYIDAIMDEMENYFPPTIEDNFDIFYIKKFPLTEENVNSYATKEILELNAKLKWGFPENELLENWRKLVKSIILSPNFNEHKSRRPEEAWTYFADNPDIAWTDMMRSIISKALSISSNTSENERIFSIYSYIKTLRRFNLLPTSVEHVIRLRFNLEKDLANIDTLLFAKAFLSSHSRPDDGSRRKTWKKINFNNPQSHSTESSVSIPTVDLDDENILSSMEESEFSDNEDDVDDLSEFEVDDVYENFELN